MLKSCRKYTQYAKMVQNNVSCLVLNGKLFVTRYGNRKTSKHANNTNDNFTNRNVMLNYLTLRCVSVCPLVCLYICRTGRAKVVPLNPSQSV